MKKLLKLVLVTDVFYVLKVFFDRYIKSSIETIYLKNKLKRKDFSYGKIFTQVRYLNFLRSDHWIARCGTILIKVNLSYKCNANCRHCYSGGLDKKFGCDMGIEDFKKVLHWAKQNDYKGIRFLGGEPTIYPKFKEILEYCRKNRMFYTVSTNNLCMEHILEDLKSFWNLGLAINYSAQLFINEKKKQLFRDNLSLLNKNNINFGLTYVIEDKDDDDIYELAEIIKKHKPSYLRVSLEIPGYWSENEMLYSTEYKKLLMSKLVTLQTECINLGIGFYTFRAVPSCLLNENDLGKLPLPKKNLYITRCEIGYKGNFTPQLTVNPDLSIFPCPSIFLSGPNILDFKDRKELNAFFKDQMRSLFTTEVNEECSRCDSHSKFLESLKKKDLKLKKFFSREACQGGCLAQKLYSSQWRH